MKRFSLTPKLFDALGRSRLMLTFVLGVLLGSGSAYAGVSVDQSPLTIRSVLPPNIVLMHDDSGSMQWTVMPDNPPGDDDRDSELINSAVNGVYYNPNIVYEPPYSKTAQPPLSHSRYAAANFEAAWYNGFNHGSTTYNIATYKPGNVFAEGPNAIGNKSPRFSHTFRVAAQPQYDYVNHNGCPSGFSGPDADGKCTLGGGPVDEPPRCQGYGTGSYDDRRDRCDQERFRPEPCGSERAPGASGQPNSPGYSLWSRSGTDYCRLTNHGPYEYPQCQGYGYYDFNDNQNNCDRVDFRPDPCGSTAIGNGNANSPGLVLDNDRCVSQFTYPSCPSGYDFSLDAGPGGEDCRRQTASGSTDYRSYFVYMVRTGTGTNADPFVDTRHYVGVSSASGQSGSENSPRAGTCSEITSNPVTNLQTNETFGAGVPVSRCQNIDEDSGLVDSLGNSVTVGQNVANWFSYYRKRDLMAKSGLMNAFATLDPTTRFGFASINGDSQYDNAANLPNDTTGGSPEIARVKPFGSGAAGTQRAAFWDWLDEVVSDGGTPLRNALKQAGEYYETAQPWRSGSTENPSNPNEELSCRQSYTILMTDGYWNGGNPNVGDADNPNGIVKREGPSGRCFEYPRKSTGSTCSSPIDEDPYVDGADNTLADVAMDYWLRDLRPADNLVPTSTENPAFWQHMATFTVGLFGKDATLANVTPSGTTAEDVAIWASNGQAPNNFDWPSPSSDSVNNISDMVHAGINGRGGFYAAGDPQAFQRGLEDALRRVQERVGTGASLAANSTRLDTGTTTYQSLYFSGDWKGDLRAFPVDPNSGVISTTADWSAADQLPDAASRTVKTCNPCGTSSNSTEVDFEYANLSNAQKVALSSSSQLVDFLLGDDSNTAYRSRDTALGDIINSQPVYVGPPSPNIFAGRTFPGSGSYTSFASGAASRDPLLWVAANDGMIHAFDAQSGVEAYAYLPNAVILPHTFDINNDGTDDSVNGVKDLASPNYGSGAVAHQFFNDGELTVADAYDGSNWKSVLVGTTGRGAARAVYALDVTDPAAPALLWERAAEDGGTNSNWIGQVVGKPVIAQTNVSGNNSTWSVLMGNGYNSDADKAALLQFNLFTGALTVHTAGSSTGNGLAPPAVYIGDETHNVSTKAWAGDLDGVVWEFDLSCTSGCTGTTRFTDPAARPITAGMLAGVNPENQDVWVFFGTGKYMNTNDLSDSTIQRWYGLIVAGSNLVDATTTDSDLVERSIVEEEAATSSELGARVLEEDNGEMVGKSGWFMPLVPPNTSGQGERMITPNQFQGALLLGVTRIPGSTDPCNPSGRGWIMAVNPFTGANPGETFFDRDGDGDFDDDDKLNDSIVGGLGFSSIPNNPIFVGNIMLVSFDDATTSSIATAGSAGATQRMSWRELVVE